VACPYFFPKERTFAIGWQFPQRLPLGGGFCGTCRARAEEFVPDDATLKDFCNLGHADGCPRMPLRKERRADSLRFAVASDADGKIVLHYAYDQGHAPLEYGRLEYNCSGRRWKAKLNDACAQRQAECYLSLYLQRRPRSVST
jgi:hypothetical protein